MLNENQEALIPILEFTIYQIELKGYLLGTQRKTSFTTVASCLFFNPIPFKWEPIVEKFGLNIEIISSNKNPKLQIVVNSLPDYNSLNIDISDQMVTYIYIR